MTKRGLPTDAQMRVLEIMADGEARRLMALPHPWPTNSWHACMRAGWIKCIDGREIYRIADLGRHAMQARAERKDAA